MSSENDYTLRRLDHLYYNRKEVWPNNWLRELAFDLLDRYDNNGGLSEDDFIEASNLVHCIINRPEYKSDKWDEE